MLNSCRLISSTGRWRLSPLLQIGILLQIGVWPQAAARDERTTLSVPQGFEVVLYADDSLAHDIYSLTIDAKGRVVVAGRGYVRILVDADGDGTAEAFRQFADGPADGAMGMFWNGNDLICTGDGGLLRYRDADGDDRADGGSEVLLKGKTGGEHDLHAIRKGPDGWWYLLGGNSAELDRRYVTLPSSPVREPAAGALVRLKPDFGGSEIISDGFRNPYDFAFGEDGAVFVWDSDGERDVSLPWYLPTRVFKVLPGASAGWLSRSWKRPDHYFDMPPLAAAFGRGSPTGVEVYRHTQFPEKYRGGLFVLDWTYGRVMFVPAAQLERGASEESAEEFLTAVGSFGFAPTDAAVGPDGSLFISVGGRGTRGGVYRVRWQEGATAPPPKDQLQRCLQAHQPLSSWSRADWEPTARLIGPHAFCRAALDPVAPAAARRRAIEILTEVFAGAGADIVRELATDANPQVRARTAWMLGRTGGPGLPLLVTLLKDDHPDVASAAIGALLTQMPSPEIDARQLAEGLSVAAVRPERAVRQLTARLLSRVDGAVLAAVDAKTAPDAWTAQMALGYAESLREPGFSPSALQRAVRCLRSGSTHQRLEAARLAALALGDVGPSGRPPVFDGYAGGTELAPHREALRELLDTVQELFPTKDQLLDGELSRLWAIVQPDDPAVLDALLARMTPDSHPIEDIHLLIVAARLPAPRSAQHRMRLADALVRLDAKIESRELPRDLNWDDRIGEMYAALVQRDPRLPDAVVGHDAFGDPGHVYFVAGVEGALQEHAVDAIVTRASSAPNWLWTGDVVRFLAAADREDVRELLRSQADNHAVSAAVLTGLARFPQPQDRELFVEGLRSADLGVLGAMLEALRRLGPGASPAEQVALVRTLRRLQDSKAEQHLNQRVVGQLEHNTGRRTPDTSGGSDAVADWTRWIEAEHAAEWAAGTGAAIATLAELMQRMAQVDGTAGDPQHGREVFVRKSCQQCHGGRRALGPDLSGVTRRFSREDLLTAIADPNRDVSPRYQTTLIVTSQGHSHTGIVIYESIDGLLLRDNQGQTMRIETDQIDVRRQLSESLMPTGLLSDLTPAELADLFAHLETID